MSHIDNLNDSALRDILTRLRILESMAPVGFTAVTRGALRIASNEGLLVEGSAKVDGWLIVTGTERVTGLLEVLGTLQGSGSIVWTGPASFSGDTSIGGNLDVTGETTLQALVTLLNDLVVSGAGKIIIEGGPSPITLQNGTLGFGTGAKLEADGGGARLVASGGSGPRVFAFPGSVGMQHSLGHSVIVTSSQTTVEGGLVTDTLSTSGAKLFSMPHPTKPDHLLQHGSTESPVSGIEYWGDAALDENGQATVELPEYFEGIAKPEGRAVFVTGRGFAADWTDISRGAFTVSGATSGRFSWLVKAERVGADFDVEPEALESEEQP